MMATALREEDELDSVDCFPTVSGGDLDAIFTAGAGFIPQSQPQVPGVSFATLTPVDTQQQAALSGIDSNALKAELLRRQVVAASQYSNSPQPAATTTPIIIKAEAVSQRLQQQQPHVQIVEEPRARGLRFRYKCEGRSAGSLPGESSTNEQKTFPTIKIHNFNGPAAIVVVSCVTKDKPHCPHPHNLVGQDCRDGVCTVKVKGRNTVMFPNIGIQCCKRHDVEESLKMRERIRVDPFGTGYFRNMNNIDLNSVRLCFQVFLPDANKKFTHIVPPVVSQPIIDKKSIHDLVICRLSRQSGYAGGGDEVFLLCEKINKDDIQVRFFEEADDGLSWEAFGDFASHDVHRQYAIVFRTPPYRNPRIQQSVQVYIQLRRPSDDEVGDPKPFQYIPQDPDPYGITNKRKRKEVNMDSIPLSVWSEVKDDPDGSEGSGLSDVKSRLKKKAVSGLQRKDMLNITDDLIGQLTLAQSATLRQQQQQQQQTVSANEPIVLTAEALTSLLASKMVSFGARNSSGSGAMTALGSMGSSNDVIQYIVDQSACPPNTYTISLDSLNLPVDNSVVIVSGQAGAMSGHVQSVEQVSNDLDVGAQEMVLENESNSNAVRQHHPLHL